MESKFENLQSQFQKYQQKNSDQMLDYQKAYEFLCRQYDDYQKQVEKGLTDVDSDIDEILKHTDKMVQMNQDLFERIKLINTTLSKDSPSPDEIKQLTDQISNDVEMRESLVPGDQVNPAQHFETTVK